MTGDLRDGHLGDTATIVRGMDVAGRSPAAGRLDLARLVTHRFPPGRTDEASTAAVAEPEGSGTVVVTRAELSAPESSGATR